MPTTIMHVVGVGTGGTENAIASIDIPEDGRISSVCWAMEASLNADAEEVRSEVSFISTNQADTNDARGVISSIAAKMGMLTSGAGIVSVNHQEFYEDLRVSGGERIHLHIMADAGVGSRIQCNVHLETRSGTRRSARRR